MLRDVRHRTLPPHAPCRLQRLYVSTLPIIGVALPPHAPCRLQLGIVSAIVADPLLCLHTLRADCNNRSTAWSKSEFIFASTRSVQIATAPVLEKVATTVALPPHAPCRLQLIVFSARFRNKRTLPPHAPCRLQRSRSLFAVRVCPLCLHTLRADCNGRNAQNAICTFQNVC